MAWTVRNCALTLAMVAAAIMSSAAVSAAQVRDCWLLEGSDLERARARGQCQDSFARNGEAPAKRQAARPKAKVKTVESKARAVEPSPQVAAVPSWSSPREEVPSPPVEAEIARSGTYAVRVPAPPPPSPPESFADGLRRDLEHFVQDLDRDFSSFWRAIAGGSPRPNPDVQISER